MIIFVVHVCVCMYLCIYRNASNPKIARRTSCGNSRASESSDVVIPLSNGERKRVRAVPSFSAYMIHSWRMDQPTVGVVRTFHLRRHDSGAHGAHVAPL